MCVKSYAYAEKQALCLDLLPRDTMESKCMECHDFEVNKVGCNNLSSEWKAMLKSWHCKWMDNYCTQLLAENGKGKTGLTWKSILKVPVRDGW